MRCSQIIDMSASLFEVHNVTQCIFIRQTAYRPSLPWLLRRTKWPVIISLSSLLQYLGFLDQSIGMRARCARIFVEPRIEFKTGYKSAFIFFYSNQQLPPFQSRNKSEFSKINTLAAAHRFNMSFPFLTALVLSFAVISIAAPYGISLKRRFVPLCIILTLYRTWDGGEP